MSNTCLRQLLDLLLILVSKPFLCCVFIHSPSSTRGGGGVGSVMQFTKTAIRSLFAN